MGNADHLKRLALQIAAQLPEADADAFYVLALTTDLVRHLAQDSGTVIRPSGPAGPALRLVPGAAGEGPTALRDIASPR